MIPAIDREAFLEKRLGDHGRHIEDGVTTPELRVARMREAIERAGVAEAIIGPINGKPVTYREYFQRAYGVPL